MANIFIVARDIGKDEADVQLVKAFENENDAIRFMDGAEAKLTSLQSHIYYYIEEIELVGGTR